VRDPQASEPFDPGVHSNELERVFAYADADSPFLGRVARFLAYTGAHVSMLSGGYRQELVHLEGVDELRLTYQEPLNSTYIKGEYLYWRRPKNEKAIGMPISRHVAPWLAEFLDEWRPRTRRRYGQLLGRLSPYVRTRVNPLRFRHTCAVLLFHVYGMDAPTICRLLGVTAATLTTYVMRPQWMVLKELRQKGW
jgi:integrase